MSGLEQEYEQRLDWAYRVFRFVPYILAAYPAATREQIAQAFSRDCACPYHLAYEYVGLALQKESCTE